MITGLHHITLVMSDARRTAEFYTRVLGLRLVKKTVNFDDPGSYHLYFGDETGSPGSAITYFEWPGAGRGAPGIGGTHHFALTVADRDGLLMWKRRLVDHGVHVTGPMNRHYFESLYFTGPDGEIIEIATRGPGMSADAGDGLPDDAQRTPPEALVKGARDEGSIAAESWPEPVPEIVPAMRLDQGMHHISAMSSDVGRTSAFLEGVLGVPLVKRQRNFDDLGMLHWYWSPDGGRPGTLLTYFGMDAERTRRARMGAGQTHHYALAVPDDATQLAMRERLLEAGIKVSPVMDRTYFKSIYTADPDGHIVEVATATPGFAVDEPVESLGQALKLPKWLEGHRATLETSLRPIPALGHEPASVEVGA
jgi:glyoxalase family protein